nr:phosphoribosylformylglycinamidine synthase [uncultured Oribacterium sp.]
MDKRIFVRKREQYRQEEEKLVEELFRSLSIPVKRAAIYQIYDVYSIEEEVLKRAEQSVFSEVMVNEVFEELPLQEGFYFAYETLPAQFDQRADSAMQCIRLLDAESKAFVRSGTLLVFDRALSPLELEKISRYLVNPIESQEKDMSLLSFSPDAERKEMRDMSGFRKLSTEALAALKKEMNLSLLMEDLLFIQEFYRGEERDPSETELYVLDCYWSDHCRHTTFETLLDKISVESKHFQKEMEEALQEYLSLRKELGTEKPVTLMDMATIVGKYHRIILKDQTVEVSSENNACSFFTTVEHDGKEEQWLIQFKNETHNHPTEIEPFGGASTCIGGAIRDPLSGRSFVYQAMRISGAGNVLEGREKTLPNKLPQAEISKKAMQGYSSYGNQIGLATSFVRELYDDSYVAKHMEVGAVVGASPVENVRRELPAPGDIVVLIGGRTGRDGIQGASGSSVVHTSASLHTMASQVQKGNAPEERKIQRLFRRPEVSRLIKKCNDFGAGGVAVAIGEISPGMEIHLDKVLLKYQGLNATEIAISESQERMAVVVSEKDYASFVKACEEENIEYALVATVTNRNRLEMFMRKEKVVDLKASFLETSGVRQHREAVLTDHPEENPFLHQNFHKEQAEKELSEKNVASQKGLATNFDSSIGATTVLMPFTGKEELTPVQASVQALPTLGFDSDVATVLTYGFIPKISHYSPFLSALYSVLLSVAKVYAVGGDRKTLYLSCQEYFEKLGTDSKKWGMATEALLGALYAERALGISAIGGKDSMSGTFNDLHVVETLISFACSTVKIEEVLTPELKKCGNTLYFLPLVKDERGFPNIAETVEKYDTLHRYISEKKVCSVYVLEEGSAFSALYKMAVGNDLGFHVTMEDLSDFQPGSMVIEASASDLPFRKIGTVEEDILANGEPLDKETLRRAYTGTFETLYPEYVNLGKGNCENLSKETERAFFSPEKVDQVKVLIPVFPGTNCEYDSARAFQKEGAEVETVIIRNKREQDLKESMEEFVEKLRGAHILMFVGGFSSGDEPDGSAKFIVNFLRNEKVKEAVHSHLKKKRLILGICNGFQALLKSGLLPYGEIRDLSEEDLTLYHNDCMHHVSTTAFTRVSNTNSAWTRHFRIGEMHDVVFSHGEGKLVGKSIEKWKHLAAFQYADFDGNASLNGKFNPNGSLYGIEGMVSEDGLILGKMGHSERYGEGLYRNRRIPNPQNLFYSGVQYFKGAK